MGKHCSQTFKLMCAFVFVITAALQTPRAHSQGQRPSLQSRMAKNNTKKQLTTIVFSGLAGAILGLSTLSFYGRPQDKLSNIAIGFAIGVIGGTIYATSQAVVRSPSSYRGALTDSEAWDKLASLPQKPASDVSIFNYQFTF